MVGEMLGRYRIVAKLGAGGMGEVYQARDEQLGRDVAIKLLPPAGEHDDERLRRLTNEARAASGLNHPHIVAIYEIGDAHGAPFIAMELVTGVTLRERLRGGALPLHDALAIATQVAVALSAAHETGLIHRDVKPDNVMVRHDGAIPCRSPTAPVFSISSGHGSRPARSGCAPSTGRAPSGCSPGSRRSLRRRAPTATASRSRRSTRKAAAISGSGGWTTRSHLESSLLSAPNRSHRSSGRTARQCSAPRGRRRAMCASGEWRFFIEPEPMPLPFTITYSKVVNHSNLFQMRLPQ